jgi:hypothetical protein
MSSKETSNSRNALMTLYPSTTRTRFFGITASAIYPDLNPAISESEEKCRFSAPKPDWTRDGKAACFKRNDRMLDIVPASSASPGSGITVSPAGKAKRLGIPVLNHGQAPLLQALGVEEAA